MKKSKFVFARHFGRQGIAQIVADALSHLVAAKYPPLNGTACMAQCEWTKSGDGIRVSLIFDHEPVEDTPVFDDEPFILYDDEYEEDVDENLIN
jgi:hypothetical protein